MKKFTASRFLIVAASVWIFLGSIALFSYRNSDLPAIKYAGILLLLDGFLLIAVSFSCDAILKEKKWIIAEAIVSLLFSTLLLLDPVFTLFAFPFIVGPWIVSKGIVTMIAALSLKKNIHGWSGDLTGGFLLICCGLLIAHHPMDSPQGLNVLIGAIGWTAGLLYLYDAYRFSKINPGPSYLKTPTA
jgi:uncharacterized membrane protein HdeD (DUF308 family)